MHKIRFQFSKFFLVGGLNFVFTFLMFFLFVKFLNINYIASLVFVSIVGMLFTYSLNYIWVFKPGGSLKFGRRLAKYMLAGLLSLAINTWILKYLVDRTSADPFYVQVFLIPFIVIFNFLTAKLWSLCASCEDD